MKHAYTHLIPENTAPAGATRIAVLDSQGTDIGSIALGGLAPPVGEPDYRIIVVSDPHIGLAHTESIMRKIINNANDDPLCSAVVVCGDLVNDGRDDSQRSIYADIIESSAKPVYSISGNHDAMWGYPTDSHMESYTGKASNAINPGYPLYYAVAATADSESRIFANPDLPSGDIHIFLGHYGKDHTGNGAWYGGEQFSAEELAWFESVMAANADKRRFVYIHPYIPNTAGDPPIATDSPKKRPPNLWDKHSTVSTDAGADFLEIVNRYPGAMIVNGHSHYRFSTQEEYSPSNVYTADNYQIIHTPSPTRLRVVKDGWRYDYEYGQAGYGGEGYIMDVYADCTYFRGRDFVNHVWVGIGTYRF